MIRECWRRESAADYSSAFVNLLACWSHSEALLEVIMEREEELTDVHTGESRFLKFNVQTHREYREQTVDDNIVIIGVIPIEEPE